MTDKALISDLTWRSLDMQRKAFPDMPHFVAPNDVASLLRPTRRQQTLRICVVSLGVMSDTEKNFLYILSGIRKIKAHIWEEETRTEYHDDCPIKNVVNAWKVARRDGAAKIGAKISADRKKARVRQACALISDRWPMPSSEHPTSKLLEEAGISLNSVKAVLGSRPIAQYNYRTKHGKQIKQLEISPKPLREKVDFCGVYIFQIEEGVYKVGSSNDSGRRFKQVSQHHKKHMKVVETFNMDRDTAYRVEMEAHYLLRKLIAKEYNGREIFNASLETVKKAINKAIKNVTEAPRYD